MDIDIIEKLNDWTLLTHKNLFVLFSRKAEIMPNLENQRLLHFEFQCQKSLRSYHNTYTILFYIDLSTKSYRGLLFNRTHLPLFQNMSVKIYINFSYLQEVITSKLIIQKIKWNMECEFMSRWTIWHYPHCNTGITFCTGGQATMKSSKMLSWDIWV